MRPDVINVGVFLDDVTEFNGPLYFVLAATSMARS